MGLLIGASTITIFELLDLIVYNLCVKCCDREKNRRPPAERVPSRDASLEAAPVGEKSPEPRSDVPWESGDIFGRSQAVAV
jgi:hypothetical protein